MMPNKEAICNTRSHGRKGNNGNKSIILPCVILLQPVIFVPQLYSTGVYCCNSVIAKVCFPLISFPLFPLNNTSSADPLSLSCAQVTLFSQRNILFSIPCSATLFFHQYYTGNSFLDRLQIDL